MRERKCEALSFSTLRSFSRWESESENRDIYKYRERKRDSENGDIYIYREKVIKKERERENERNKGRLRL